MLPSLAAHRDIAIVAAADPSEAARAHFVALYGGVAYPDAQRLFDARDVDAVYIATPHQFHVGHALAAAEAGKHFIVEKPLALTIEDCRRIVDAAQRAGVVSLVGHTHGFDPGVRKMREIIASGQVGRLRMLSNIVYTDFLYRPRRPEELDTRAGGGIMFNQVPHQLEIARVLAQEPIRAVRATTGVWDSARPTEGAMSAFVEFDSGVTATLTYSGYDHLDTDEFCSWIGAGGRPKTPGHGNARRTLAAAKDMSESQARLARGLGGSRHAGDTAPPTVHQPHFGLLLVSCEKADMRISPGGITVYDDAGVREVPLPAGRAAPNRDAVADDFVAAVVRKQAPLQDAAWGQQTMEAVFALMKSASERREIRLPDAG
jgi:phthalate 4,5-cis-dihydrodiol dehydrogenase